MTRAELKRKIKRDAASYDKAVAEYNQKVKKERAAGNLIGSKNLKAANTKAGRAALKRVLTAYNAVAKKGQILRKDISEYSRRYE